MNGLLSYIQFIDIKGTAWGHGQVIEMCSHAIFYISCIEWEPGIIARLLVAIRIYVSHPKHLWCKKGAAK